MYYFKSLFLFIIINLPLYMIAQDKLVYINTAEWAPENIRIYGDNNVIYKGDNIVLNRVEIPAGALQKIEERYKQELQVLKNKLVGQQFMQKDLAREITILQTNTTAAILQAQQLNDQFRSIDFKQSSALFNKAYQTFLKGEFTQTLDLLSIAQLDDQDRKNADNRKLRANLLAIQYEFSKARQEFERACQIFESFGNYFDYAYFLLLQTDYSNAKSLFQKSLQFFSQKLQKALVSTNLGIIARAQNQPQQAVVHHEDAVHSLIDVLQEQPEYISQAAGILNNIGNTLTDLGKVLSAKNALENALKIRKELVKIDPKAFKPDLATTLMNLGYLYRSRQEIDTALIYYMQALPIRRSLAKEDKSLALKAALAMLLSNIGDAMQEKMTYSSAQIYYKEAITIYQDLAKINPEVYKIEVAGILVNQAYLLYETKKNEEAIGKYEEAKKIYSSLDFITFPGVDRNLGIIYHNEGLCYDAMSDSLKALSHFKSAIEIRSKILNNDNLSSLADLGQSYNCLGNVLTDQKKWEEGLVAYQKSFELRKQAAQRSPLVYSLDMTETLINLGGLFLSLWIENPKQNYKINGLQYLNNAMSILKHFPNSPWALKQMENAELKIAYFNN